MLNFQRSCMRNVILILVIDYVILIKQNIKTLILYSNDNITIKKFKPILILIRQHVFFYNVPDSSVSD